jgi:hypothetical protein
MCCFCSLGVPFHDFFCLTTIYVVNETQELVGVSQSYVTTDGQSASLSWNKAPIWSLRPDFYYCQTIAGLLMWGALSDERTGLSFIMGSRDSVVGIATGYALEDRGFGVRVPVGSRIFSSPRRPDRFWGPRDLLSNGYCGFFPPGVKRPGREADHSPPASVEVKKIWIYTSTPPYAFMA